MNKTLITCPVCNRDQHVYANALCTHTDSKSNRCPGSRLPLIHGRPTRIFKQKIFEKVQLGTAYRGVFISQRFYVFNKELMRAGLALGTEIELQETTRGFMASHGGVKEELTQWFDV
jgi:hypothetical protein